MSQRWKKYPLSNRRSDGRLSAGLVAGLLTRLMEAGEKYRTKCKNGKKCPHSENCKFADCPTKPLYVQELEKESSRDARFVIRLLMQKEEKIAELTAENKALKAKVLAETKSQSKKRGKKSSGAGAGDAVVDDMNLLSLDEFNEIILNILRENRVLNDEGDYKFMTCAEIGLAFMKHAKNPSEHRLTKMFLHFRKNNKIAGYFKNPTKYIPSLENVVEGSRRGALKTFGFSVEEEVSPSVPSAPATLDDELPVADVSLGSLFEPVAPAAPAALAALAALSAPDAPVLKPQNSNLVVPPMSESKSDGN